MTKATLKLKDTADKAKADYNYGRITREKAKDLIAPYIEHVNKEGMKIAKEYGVKHRPVSVVGYLR